MFTEHLSKSQCTFWRSAPLICTLLYIALYYYIVLYYIYMYFISFQPLLLDALLPLCALRARLVRLVNPAVKRVID